VYGPLEPVGVPEVTAVIPTHNRSRLLAHALRSALWQEGVDLEVVVVDDGSSDDTPEVVASFRDDRVRLVRNKVSQRVAAARNRGVAEARGRWVGFLDDDDIWAPNKLARQVAAAQRQSRCWVYAGVIDVTEDLKIVGIRSAPSPKKVIQKISRYNVIPGGGSNVIATRAALLKAGPFERELYNTEDWEMWIRLAKHGPPAALEEPLLAYRVHPYNASLDISQILAGVSWIERRHGTRADRGLIHRWLGESSLRTGKRGRALKHFAVAALRGQARGVESDVIGVLSRKLAHALPGRALVVQEPIPISAFPWLDVLEIGPLDQERLRSRRPPLE
jgi:glycosyltransferase involved in cell wall biosynthesis